MFLGFVKTSKSRFLKYFYIPVPIVYDRMAPHSQTRHRTPTQDWKKLGF